MSQRTRPGHAILGLALSTLLAGGCSGVMGSAEVVPETAANIRIKEATEATTSEVSAETQERIDAYTAYVVTSIERAGDFLAAQEKFSFQADVAYGVVQANGQILEFGGTNDVLVRRPDRLRIESVDRDGGIRQSFFDGKTILIDIPTEDVYIRIDRPGSLYDAMDYLVDDLGALVPLDDFISENFAAGAKEKIESGFYVQRVMLDDFICEHLAWRTQSVDVQIWFREGDEPVPCRVVITYRNAEGHPQYAADFHDWNLAPDVDDELFVFEPPESAEQLQIQGFIQERRDEMGGK